MANVPGIHQGDTGGMRHDIDDLGRSIVNLRTSLDAATTQIAALQSEINRLKEIVVGTQSGGVTIRSAAGVSIAGGVSTLDVGERVTAKSGQVDIYASVISALPQAGKASQTINFMAGETTTKFNRWFTRVDSRMEVNAIGGFKLTTAGDAYVSGANLVLDMTMLTVKAPRSDFVQGQIRARNVVAEAMVAASYSPGAGNLW